MAGLAAVGYGRHIGCVSFQEHLVHWYKCRGIAHVLRVLERYDSCKADEYICASIFKVQKLCAEFRTARKTVNVNLGVAKVGSTEYGEGVVIGFAEVKNQRFLGGKTEF